MRRKIQRTMFVWVCELHRSKIKTKSSFGWEMDSLVGLIMLFMLFFMAKKKLPSIFQISLKIVVFLYI